MGFHVAESGRDCQPASEAACGYVGMERYFGRAVRVGGAAVAVCLLAATGAAAQEPRGFCPPPGCQGLSLDRLVRMSKEDLEHLYRQAEAGTIPEGYARGMAIRWPGTIWTVPMSKAIHVLWHGKIFDAEEGMLINRWSCGVEGIRANVGYGPSWLDGKPSIIMDYQDSSRISTTSATRSAKSFPACTWGSCTSGNALNRSSRCISPYRPLPVAALPLAVGPKAILDRPTACRHRPAIDPKVLSNTHVSAAGLRRRTAGSTSTGLCKRSSRGWRVSSSVASPRWWSFQMALVTSTKARSSRQSWRPLLGRSFHAFPHGFQRGYLSAHALAMPFFQQLAKGFILFQEPIDKVWILRPDGEHLERGFPFHGHDHRRGLALGRVLFQVRFGLFKIDHFHGCGTPRKHVRPNYHIRFFGWPS